MPPVMKILYGPPGTGKTYRAIREAVQVIDGAVDPETVTDRFRQLVLTGRIFPVTFHPSYSYEDFVEGFRPRPGRDGSIVYEIVDGPFKLACAAARRAPLFRVGEEIGGYRIERVDPCGVLLRSGPITRKDRTSEYSYTYVDFWTIDPGSCT